MDSGDEADILNSEDQTLFIDASIIDGSGQPHGAPFPACELGIEC